MLFAIVLEAPELNQKQAVGSPFMVPLCCPGACDLTVVWG